MSRQFLLNKSDAKIMGVCAGISDYFGWDVTLIRIGFVAAALFGFGSPVLIYLLIGVIAKAAR
ncbi:PspC domain-containing protein [Sandarakinorhabdus sp.]|uniref:PspC domain-containing protein n=1 Tax=Sandarakinorhabdus sp. TaxID=1916663 RepID=UPI003F714BA1